MNRIAIVALAVTSLLSITGAHAQSVGPQIAEQGNQALEQIRKESANTLHDNLRGQMALPAHPGLRAELSCDEQASAQPSPQTADACDTAIRPL